MDALAVADPLDLFFSRRACTCSCGSPLRLVLREDRQGERFAQALAAKDDAAFCALVDRLDFQALTPGCHWQADTSRLCLKDPWEPVERPGAVGRHQSGCRRQLRADRDGLLLGGHGDTVSYVCHESSASGESAACSMPGA